MNASNALESKTCKTVGRLLAACVLEAALRPSLSSVHRSDLPDQPRGSNRHRGRTRGPRQPDGSPRAHPPPHHIRGCPHFSSVQHKYTSQKNGVHKHKGHWKDIQLLTDTATIPSITV